MAVQKSYDDMADRYVYRTTIYNIPIDKKFGQVQIRAGYVDLKDGGDTFWLILMRRGTDWYWLNRTQFIVRAGDQRFGGVGGVQNSDVSYKDTWYGTSEAVCYEEIHCPGGNDMVEAIAATWTVKMRLGDVDMEFPSDLVEDIKGIAKDLRDQGGYGA